MKTLFILGAPDPEMEAIEHLLASLGQDVQFHAADGRRVTPREAYSGSVSATDEYQRVVLVECGPVVRTRQKVIRVDHHFPGDPGFGRPPQEFWAASSLGQVASLLGVDATPDLLCVAACDHCLAAAWAEKCPGVTRDMVLAYRARLATTRPVPCTEDEYRESFATTLAAIRSSSRGPILNLGAQHLPELPDAACYAGIAYTCIVATRDGSKEILGGVTTPEMVRNWMENAALRGLTDIYGDPIRGFAGGYLP